jgi:hypothetical protein
MIAIMQQTLGFVQKVIGQLRHLAYHSQRAECRLFVDFRSVSRLADSSSTTMWHLLSDIRVAATEEFFDLVAQIPRHLF